MLSSALDLVNVAEVDLRVDTLREQVDAEGNEVDVSGALTVAEQAALNTVSSGQVAEFGGSDGRAAVVMWVQGKDHIFAMGKVARHPLNRVCVHVRGRHLDRRR